MTVIKRPGERYTFTYEFADQLGAATISGTPVVVSTPQNGGANLSKAAPVVDGKNVLVSWEGGDDGHDYLTLVTVTASDGSRYETGGTIAVRALVGDGVPGARPRGRITLADAKWQLRIEPDDTERDEEIAGFIADAEAWVERYTGHVIVARDVTQVFDAGCEPFRLRAWPIRPDAVVAMSYPAADGSAVPVTDAGLLMGDRPWRVTAGYLVHWPWRAGDRVTVTVRAGYEAGDAIPGTLRRAMLVLIGAMDTDRDGSGDLAKAEAVARDMCGTERLWTV